MVLKRIVGFNSTFRSDTDSVCSLIVCWRKLLDDQSILIETSRCNQRFFSEPPQLIIEIVITWCYRKPFHNTEILSHSSTWRLKRISNFLHFTYLSLHIDTTLVLPLIIVIFHLHSTQMILRQLLHPTKPNGLESFEGRLTGKNVTGEG